MKAYILSEHKGIVLIANKAYQIPTNSITSTYAKWSMSQLSANRLYKEVKSSDMNTARKLLQTFRTKGKIK